MALDRFGDIKISSQEEAQDGRDSWDGKNAFRDPDITPSEQENDPDNSANSGHAAKHLPARRMKYPSGRKRYFARMMRWLVFLLVAVGLYGATAYFLIPVLIQNVLIPSVAGRLSRPVVIDRVVFSPFTLKVLLSGISIGGHYNEHQSNAAFLQSGSLHCRLGLEQIFAGKLTCNAIVLDDATIHLQRTAAGFVDLGDLANILALQYTDTFENIWPPWLAAGEFTLSGGTIVLHDTVNSREYQVEELELYLPPLHQGNDTASRLPELSAIVNGSPVHVEAVRILNNAGKLETSLDLRVREASLIHYREYFPLRSSEYSLADGRADVNLRIVFPVGKENRNRFILTGDASLSGVSFEGQDARRIVDFPAIRFGFSIMPREKELLIRNMSITQPVVDVFLRAEGNEPRSGLSPKALAAFAASAIKSDRKIRIEELEAVDGKLRFFKDKGVNPAFVWDDASCKLRKFTTPAWGIKDGQDRESAYFAFNATDKSGSEPMNLSAEGQIHPGRGSGGRFSVTHLDLHKYGDFLPFFGLVFDHGKGDIRFSYDYATGKAETERESGYSFLLSEGYADLVDYSLHPKEGGVKSIAGRKLTCEGFQADPSSRSLNCASLIISDSTIDATSLKSPDESLSRPGKMKWQMNVGAVQINGSRVQTSFLKDICPAAPDLTLEGLVLSGENLVEAGKDAKISIAAKWGRQGKVNLTGAYSPMTKQGRLNVVLQNIDFRAFGPCLDPVVIPEVKQGDMDLRGTYALPEKEFTGRIAVKNMRAGSEEGPLVTWHTAVAEKVFLHLRPLVLDLGSVLVTKPVIHPGIMNSEIVIDNFIRPDSHVFAQFGADEIRVEEGRFAMPWPVILPGYQPELTQLEGKLEALGGGLSPFSLKGRAEGFADFTLKGILDRDSVRSYSLAATDMHFAPFAPYLKGELGLSADTLAGSLQQDLVRSEADTVIGNRLVLKDVDPDPDSSFYPVYALMLDETGKLTVGNEERVAPGSESPFLLFSIKRYFQHQEVRAALDQRLVLNESLADIDVVTRISFEPGSAVILDLHSLPEYDVLLARRPLLGLILHPSFDEASDRVALHDILQKEADRKREAENKRRVLENRKRQEEQSKKMAELKDGKSPIISEEITGEELDLEPLPYLQVNVSTAMLEDLARRRAAAVADYLIHTLNIAPERIRIEDKVKTGSRQVGISLFPVKSATE